MLALKHRQDKSQRQRLVVFVGSPVAEDEATLVRLGKKLKKNNVAVDVVAFANLEENEAKLQARPVAVTMLRDPLRSPRNARVAPPGVCGGGEQQQQQQSGDGAARLAQPGRRPPQVRPAPALIVDVEGRLYESIEF